MNQMTCHIRNPYVEHAIVKSIELGEYQEYAPPKGLPNLHEMVLKDFGLQDTDAEVCVTDGSLPAIYQAICYTCPPDTNSIFVDSEPAWSWPRRYSKRELLKTTPVKIAPDDIEDKSFVYICSPHNPIGFEYTVEELEALAMKARDVDAWILQDCTYKDFSNQFFPIYKIHPNKTITTWSMSKSPGMAGMRVGGVICNPKMMKEIFTLRPNQLGSNLPGQRAAVAALEAKDQWLPNLLEKISENREYIYSNLNIGFCPKPDRANGVWIEFPKEYNSTTVTEQLDEKKLLVRDGIYYKDWGYKGNFIKVGIAVPHEWIEELVYEINNL